MDGKRLVLAAAMLVMTSCDHKELKENTNALNENKDWFYVDSHALHTVKMKGVIKGKPFPHAYVFKKSEGMLCYLGIDKFMNEEFEEIHGQVIELKQDKRRGYNRIRLFNGTGENFRLWEKRHFHYAHFTDDPTYNRWLMQTFLGSKQLRNAELCTTDLKGILTGYWTPESWKQ